MSDELPDRRFVIINEAFFWELMCLNLSQTSEDIREGQQPSQTIFRLASEWFRTELESVEKFCFFLH